MLNKNFRSVLNQKLFEVLIQCTQELNTESYLIGGFVRDHLLGREKAKDIDIVAVGSGIELAKAIKQKLPNAKPIQIFKSYRLSLIHI